MSEIDKKLEELGKELLDNKITPEEHVERYNQLISQESRRVATGWRPHEHI